MLNDNPYVNCVNFFEATKEFSYLAEQYNKTGLYTNTIPGTIEYSDFWTQVREYCLNGFENSKGFKVTGQHFFYLNFCPILGLNEKTGKKSKIFPRFIDLDYEFFHMVEYCRLNQKSLVAVKGRRQGWSYKAAAICTHEFYFYPDSKAIIGAFYSTFSQNTMNMVIDNSNFINMNTEFRKQRNPDLKDFIKARYQATVSGVKVWKGFNSEVRAISYKDNPTSGVGLSANWLIMDECFGKGTKILMSDRTIKNIEDIIIGDYVLRPDGSFGKVINTNTGIDDLFKITQSRGVDYVINSKHKLILEQRTKVKSYNDGITLVTPTEFLDKGKYLKRTTFGIKPIESLVFEKQEIPIDPYYLGIWLGDGDKSKTSIVVNTETDIEIKDFIYEHALQNNYKILEGNCSSTKKCKTYTTQFEYYKQNPFLDIFKKENLHYNKHIPNKYLFNTEEIRLQVLAGLIDTDGWVRKVSDTKCTYYLGTSYKNLLEDYVFLIRSLGFEVNYRTRPEKKTKFNNKIINTKESYIIAISGELSKIPVKVERKKLTNYIQTTKKNLSRIDVQSLGIGEYFGITLEATKETDSWLMLEDFSIVHNCGVFNNIVDAYGYSEPLIKDGSTYTGVALLFGSSGDMDSGSKYFYEMFTNPEKYNMLDFEDPFNPNARIGFFSSATKGRLGLCLNPESKWYKKPMVDDDGNSNHEAALDDIEFLRAKAKHGLDPKAIHNITTQFPTTWKEAFLRNKGNVFGSPEMLEWLGTLENTPSLRGQAQKGELFFDEGTVKWRPSDELNYITDFPLRKDPKSGESFSTDSCAVIWEHPEKYENGEIPNYLYIAGCLTPGEKVLTDKGLMNIEDVTLNEKLINKNGELVEIINLQRYLKDNEDVYEIKVSNTFRTTKFTQEHPIYISDNILKSDKTIDENLFNFEYQKVKNIKEDQWIKYPNIYLHDEDKVKSLITDNNIWKQDLKEIISIENFTKDFYWFIGLWLGDGWCESNGYNVSIAFNKSEEYYINKCKEIIKNIFNRSPIERIRGNCVQLSFGYKKLNSYLTDNFGKYSHGKFIPEWLKYSNEETKLSLINGYLASDGCVHKNTTGYFTTEFVSINLELLESIQDIMFSIGLVSSLNKLRDASKHTFRNKVFKTKEIYHLRLGNYDTIELKKILNNDDLKLSKIDLSNLIVRRKRAKDGCFLSDNKKNIYFKIREIKKTKYTGVVYNFECDTHTFMCHHINTHNCDPYDQDKSESGSLGSFFVYKRFYRADKTHDVIVAEYTSRPNTAEEFYEVCRKLCLYYNSKCLYENQLKGLKVYFEQKNSLHFLCEQPGIIKDVVKDSKVQRGYGIHMNRGTNGASGIKDQCELYLKKWLYEEVDGPTEGSKIVRFQTIKSIPLLKELIAYDREINTDRVIAVMLCVLQTYELHRIHVEELSNTTSSSRTYLDKLWKKSLIFKGKSSQFNASTN